MDSTTVVKSLLEVDPGFSALCETLFGGVADPGEVWDFLYSPEGIEKMMPGSADLHIPGPIKAGKGVLVPKKIGIPTAPKPAAAQVVPPKKAETLTKADDAVDVIWTGEFAKADVHKRQAFGWASVVEVGGVPVVDLQGDVIRPEDIEEAAYVFVEKSRIGGDQHARDLDDLPIKAGHLIESFVSTPEKISKMGLPDDFPVGWWVGFQYAPGDAWEDIAAGRKTGFSIHGRGKRIPLLAA